MLARSGDCLGLSVYVSRNSDERLRKKRKKNPDQQHKCRSEHADLPASPRRF